MCTYLMYCEFVRCAFIVSHTQEESNLNINLVKILDSDLLFISSVFELSSDVNCTHPILQ